MSSLSRRHRLFLARSKAPADASPAKIARRRSLTMFSPLCIFKTSPRSALGRPLGQPIQAAREWAQIGGTILAPRSVAGSSPVARSLLCVLLRLVRVRLGLGGLRTVELHGADADSGTCTNQE